MSDFTVYNSYDGSTTGVNVGGLIKLNSAIGALLSITQNTDQPGGQPSVLGYPSAVMSLQNLSYYAGAGSLTIRTAATFQVAAAIGIYPVGIAVSNLLFQAFSITLTVRPATGNTVPPITLPEDVFDLSVDLLLRTVASALLPLTDGFKASDNIKFGVIPSRATTGFIASGITALQLALRPVGNFLGDPLVIDIDSPDLEGSGANQYYLVNFTLDSDTMNRWFDNVNAQQQGGVAGVVVDRLQVDAELRFEESAVVTTSDTFNFTVFQSVVQPAT